MERKTFLSCQPYLYPLSSLSLADDYSSSSSNEKHSREVLLDNLNLSMEPCQNTSYVQDANNGSKETNSADEELNHGPAFFVTHKATNTENSPSNAGDKYNGSVPADPSVCKVQLVLHTFGLPPRGMTTPVKKANRRDLSEIDDRVARKDETILIAKIDGNHFQVDLKQICSIRVGQSKTPNEDSEPLAFLILEMPSCCFRIYTSDASSNENSVLGGGSFSLETNDDRIKLDSVRDRLQRLLSGDSLLPFPLSYSGRINPAGKPSTQTEGDVIARTRQCLHSYSQAWNDLTAFDHVLENTNAAGSTRAKNFQETVNNLMSKIPTHVSSSFIEEEDLAKAVEMHENKIAAKMEELDSVMGVFWNETADHNRNNKRQRKDDGATNENGPKDCSGRFDDILKDHKRQIGSKHELFLLPLHG